MTRMLAGRYELEATLGRGASGTVWRARDITTRRVVAVKVIELTAVDDPIRIGETLSRFRREAVILARLRHPNVVSAMDAGRVGNELFMVMEMADGTSLAGRMEHRAGNDWGLFPVRDALRVTGQACAGLAAAHAAGVVHRDVKPGNLVVSPRLDVKVIDFGIARLLADNERITQPSTALGTLAYMSPEQAQGLADVDGRSDLYSIGCVLYELLSGHPPFTANDPQALMLMQVSAQAVPLAGIRPDLPAGLCGLVEALLRKDRAARPPDATDVMHRIEAITASVADSPPSREADRRTFQDPGPAQRPATASPARPRWAPAASTGTTGTMPAATVPAAPAPAVPVSFAPVPAGPVAPPPAPPAQAPPWPIRPPGPGRRRIRWRGVVSSLVTIAIVGGIGYYVWHRTHDILKVTTVTVALARQPGSECDITVDVTGTIVTNGHAGVVTYQWIREAAGTQTQPAATVSVAGGQRSALVHLRWAFHGKGPQPASAQLQVLAPDPAEGNVAFTYSCPA
jgi:eukaryotic-like serine/threonine-protein kinase